MSGKSSSVGSEECQEPEQDTGSWDKIAGIRRCVQVCGGGLLVEVEAGVE